jgi:hypothetical protein
MKRLSQTVSRIIRASHNPVHVVIAPLDDRHGGDRHYLNRHSAYPYNPGQRGADHHRAAPHINDSHTSGQTNHEVENSPLISMMRRLRTVDQWTIALSPNEPGEQTRYREVLIGRPIREACATAGFPGDDVSNVSNTDNASSADNGDGSNVGSGVDTGNAVDIDNEDQQKLPGPSVSSSSQSLRLVILSQVIRCAAMLTFLLISIQSLTKLIVPSGHWVWFALTASASIAIEGSIATRRRIVSCLRALGMAALLVIAAWMYCRVELDLLNAGQVGKALARSSKHGMTSAQGGSHGSISIPTLLHRGFTAVYEQLPPVQVGLASDAFLVAIIALTLVIVRLVLLSRHGFVVLSVLPISVLAVDFMILGLEPAWWQLALIVVLFAASLWARNPMWSGTATALCSSILVAVLVMAMTPSAVALANRVPISIGNSVGLLSSNTINPMVDLKRSLTQGSGATVLTYMSEQPRYLRLTTLDDFNGDMWSYDKELARDGNLYGGGIALNSPEGSESSLSGRSSNTLGVDNLVGIYMMYMMLGSFDLPNSTYYGEAGPLKDYYAGARIHIDTLNTRFLPEVGSTMNFDGVSSSWHHADDGTIYSRDHTTIPGMEYTISGTYMKPIHADGGFQQLSDISAIRKSLFLEVHNDPLPWRQRTELRHEYVRAGLAGEHDGWMFVTMTLHADGTVTDGDGDQIGTTADAQGSATSADGKNAVLYKIQFNDAFCSRTGFNVNDEPYAVSFDTDNSATLAMAMDTSAFAAMDDDGEPEGAGILDSNWANDLNEIFANINKNGIATITSLPSSQGIALPKRLIKRIADKQQQIHRDFTVLPERLPSQITAVRDKAHQSGVASTPKTSDEQIAAMKYLVDYFTSPSNAFTYSLDAPDGDGRGNMQIINDFLETKTGYCVHYAGALAILGRSLGIPTRMVLGYNSGTGKVNASGRYQVAAKQLHSWTEAYIDDIGWVPFDVTPASTDNGTKADSDSDQTSSDTSEQPTQQPSADTSTPESGKSDNQGDVDNTDEAGNPKADNVPQETGNAASDSTPFVWWRRAVANTLILMALALLLSVPWGLRRRQRKRRLRHIERAALEEEAARERNAEADVIATSGSATAGRKTDLFERSVPQKSNNTITDAHSADRYAEEYRRAWISAWSELCDTAWDMGVRWNAADTDRTIAERIAAMGPGHASRRGVEGDMELHDAAALHDAAVSQDGTALQGDTAPHGGITLSAQHQALIFGICEQAELVVFSEDPTQSRTHLPARQVPQGRLKLTELNQRIAGLLDAIRNVDRKTHPIRTRLRLIFPSSLRRP